MSLNSKATPNAIVERSLEEAGFDTAGIVHEAMIGEITASGGALQAPLKLNFDASSALSLARIGNYAKDFGRALPGCDIEITYTCRVKVEADGNFLARFSHEGEDA